MVDFSDYKELVSKVSVRTKIEDIEREIGRKGYRLFVSVEKINDFHETINDKYPEKCFVYKRTSLNTFDNDSFERIASLQDIIELPIYTGEVNQLYRSNTYIEYFDELADILAAKKQLLISLRTLYLDLNTIYNYISRRQYDEEVVLPDYFEDDVDTLLNEYLSYNYIIRDKKETINIINSTILPTLEANEMMLSEQGIVLSKLYNIISNVGGKVTISILEEAKTIAENLKNDFTKINEDLSVIKTKVSSVNTSINSCKQMALALRSSLPGNNVNTGDFNPSAVISASTALISQCEDAITEINKLTNYLNSCSYSSSGANSSIILNALDIIIKYNVDILSQVNEIKTISSLNTSFIDKIKQSISLHKTKIKTLEKEIIELEGKIQEIEIELRKLIPSFDVRDPRKFWSVKVNINV